MNTFDRVSGSTSHIALLAILALILILWSYLVLRRSLDVTKAVRRIVAAQTQ